MPKHAEEAAYNAARRLLDLAASVDRLLGRYQDVDLEEVHSRLEVVVVDRSDLLEVLREIQAINVGKFLREDRILRDPRDL